MMKGDKFRTDRGDLLEITAVFEHAQEGLVFQVARTNALYRVADTRRVPDDVWQFVWEVKPEVK